MFVEDLIVMEAKVAISTTQEIISGSNKHIIRS